MRSALRALLATATLAVAGLGAAAPAHATEFGMSDGRPGLFDSPDLAAINFQHVRLVLPWNAAYSDGAWNEWLRRATGYGLPVMIAPSIDDAGSCTGGNCIGPTPDEYAAALKALLDRWPVITAVEAWNEPNHSMQPTSRSAALAAHYFDVAYDACAGGRCTAVAGNMLDAGSMPSYLKAYKAALTRTPAVWGIHDYFDATYFSRTGLDAMLAITNGPVWITEVGGLVTFRSGTGALPYDEHRAADSLRWIFQLAAKEPRLQRVYLYGMWQQSWNPFDSALIRQDNTEREGLQVVRANIGKRPSPPPGPEAPSIPADDGTTWTDPAAGDVPWAGAAAAGGRTTAAGAAVTSTGNLRVEGKRLKVGAKHRVTVAVRCIGPAACSGRVVVAAGSWRYRRAVALKPGARKTLRVRLTERAAGQVIDAPTTQAWVGVCGVSGCGKQSRVPLVRQG